MQLASALILSLPVVLATSAPAFQPCTPEWSPLGPGLPSTDAAWDGALEVYDDGSGPALYVGGRFKAGLGAPATGIARWNGASWSSVGAGGVEGDSRTVGGLLVFDDGGGPALFAVGAFTSIGGVPAHRSAKWDGQSWSEVGGGLSLRGSTLAVFDDGGGPALYVGGWGGSKSFVYKLEESQWVPMGEMRGLGNRWTCSYVPFVAALETFDDGSGPALYAAGSFEWVDGKEAVGLARWDGAEWSPVGYPVGDGNDCYYALESFDDGSGPALYTGGYQMGLQRWNGISWSAVPGPGAAVWSMLAHNDGTGSSLYLGGDFPSAGGQTVNSIARWDGTMWTGLGGGVLHDGQPGDVQALHEGWDNPAILFAFGQFDHAGNQPTANIARWGCLICIADCDRSGSLDASDFLCFSTLFAAGDPAADCDQSGSLDLFDFLCFTNAFNAGC